MFAPLLLISTGENFWILFELGSEHLNRLFVKLSFLKASWPGAFFILIDLVRLRVLVLPKPL